MAEKTWLEKRREAQSADAAGQKEQERETLEMSAFEEIAGEMAEATLELDQAFDEDNADPTTESESTSSDE